MSNVVVVGAGAAGMMAAIAAVQKGDKVTILEKNEKAGKKIYITGKGRCNVTNNCEAGEFFNNVVTNPKFLYSAYYGFDNTRVCELIEDYGCKLKVERGNRVFPVSDHSSDVIRALLNALNDNDVKIHYNECVTDLLINDNVCYGVACKDKSYKADKVIVATGGLSYASTGSTGDGIKWAKEYGHNINTPTPALVPLCTSEEYVKDLQGLSLKNVGLKLIIDGKTVHEDFGEMLFTHFGVSGPLILSASSYYEAYRRKKKIQSKDAILNLDLKSALSEEQLDKRIIRDFSTYNNKQFANSLSDLLPSKLIPVVVELSGIEPTKKVNLVTKEERQKLVKLLKEFTLHVTGTRGFNEAIVTQGGISVKDINPSTMESKIVSKLYFCGEALDVDALTGGFNLQIAFSTGYLAGES